MSRITCNCEGTPRRDFLKLGIGGFLGLGFADLLGTRARAAEAARAAEVQTPQGVAVAPGRRGWWAS